MWWLSAFICFALSVSCFSNTIKEHICKTEDTIKSELLNDTMPTNFQNLTNHLKDFNSYVQNVVDSFKDETLKQYRDAAESVLKTIGTPIWVFEYNFSRLQNKYHWDDEQVHQVHSLIKEANGLWGKFDTLCRKHDIWFTTAEICDELV